MSATPEDAIAAFEAAIPDDPRVVRKKMFGMPAVFLKRQMFFGTHHGTVVARVGPERAKALAGQPGMRIFEPTAGRQWADYIEVDVDVAGDGALKGLAQDALAWTDKLPPKGTAPVPERKRKG